MADSLPELLQSLLSTVSHLEGEDVASIVHQLEYVMSFLRMAAVSCAHPPADLQRLQTRVRHPRSQHVDRADAG